MSAADLAIRAAQERRRVGGSDTARLQRWSVRYAGAQLPPIEVTDENGVFVHVGDALRVIDSLRADVARLTAEREHFKAANAAYDKQVTRLIGERQGYESEAARLTGERDAFKCLCGEAEGKVVDLPTDVEEAETERDNARRQLGVVQNSCRISERRATTAEQQLTALRASIEQFEQRMFDWAKTMPSPQQTRQKSAREMVELFARDLHSLLAAIKEPATP